MTEGFDYTGKEELEQQSCMPCYNNHIASLFLKKINAGDHAVDFGAGIGTISSLVKEKTPDTKIICIELDQDNATALKKKGFKVLSDASACPPESMDIVYSSNVLEHIENDEAILKTLSSLLKPGGYAAFWVPAFHCLWTPMDDRVCHYRRYTKKSMTCVFENAGFKVEKCFYQDSLGFFVTLLFKLIGSKNGTVSTKSLRFYDKIIFPVSRVLDYICSPFFGKNVFIYARKL